jgi:hypothetical protein
MDEAQRLMEDVENNLRPNGLRPVQVAGRLVSTLLPLLSDTTVFDDILGNINAQLAWWDKSDEKMHWCQKALKGEAFQEAWPGPASPAIISWYQQIVTCHQLARQASRPWSIPDIVQMARNALKSQFDKERSQLQDFLSISEGYPGYETDIEITSLREAFSSSLDLLNAIQALPEYDSFMTMDVPAKEDSEAKTSSGAADWDVLLATFTKVAKELSGALKHIKDAHQARCSHEFVEHVRTLSMAGEGDGQGSMQPLHPPPSSQRRRPSRSGKGR